LNRRQAQVLLNPRWAYGHAHALALDGDPELTLDGPDGGDYFGDSVRAGPPRRWTATLHEVNVFVVRAANRCLIVLCMLAGVAGADNTVVPEVTKERRAVEEICRLMGRGPIDAQALPALLDGTSLSLVTLSNSPNAALSVDLRVAVEVRWSVGEWSDVLGLFQRAEGFKCDTEEKKGKPRAALPKVYVLKSGALVLRALLPVVERRRVKQFTIVNRQQQTPQF
jgi:hypothetical protein